MAKYKEKRIAFWDHSLKELLACLETTSQGLTSAEAEQRLQQIGPNTLKKKSRLSIPAQLLRFFGNPLILILLMAGTISFFLGQTVNAVIIIVMVLLSVALNFYQEFQANKAVEALMAKVALQASVIRDGREQKILTSKVVPGDILILHAGDLVPADSRLVEAKDLYVRESALTGESLPSEKNAEDLSAGEHDLSEARNAVFLGTAVQSGIARAVTVATGSATAYGKIAARLTERPPETEFDHGIRHFGLMITRIILLLILFVTLVNIISRRPVLDSFLFAVALAVGLTPELLPVIISVTLAQGARRMSKKKVIVKQLASMENFGSMEILCSDKTGTLTEGTIILDQHVNIDKEKDERVLELAYLNSYFEAGIKNPLDDAILKHEHPEISAYTKVDEIPFDFTRRRLSVVVRRNHESWMIAKGAPENILEICIGVYSGEKIVSLDNALKEKALSTYRDLSLEGYRLLAVAVRPIDVKEAYGIVDETDMTLAGFTAFLDPPKPDAGATLQRLRDDGIRVIIMTGDNEYVTKKIADDVGLKSETIISGSQVDDMNDAALAYQAENGAIFARVSPEQKNRIITALKNFGRVVGFLGDGINDAPSLYRADIGISVVNGVDVARDAANIILLKKSLSVLHDGIIEGRSSFANVMKYIIMGTSSNFGNMFSMAAASIFLPFLPMLPTQILLNNFLYDMSQISIPNDNVDRSLLQRPKRWRISFIRQFMMIIGPISSIYDFMTFAILLSFFHADERLFHTGWFLESLATQTLVIFIIRTAGNPLLSRPGRRLTASVLGITALGVLLPYSPVASWMNFDPLPLPLLGTILFLTITYLGLVQLVKTWFYKRHELI
jgi:Mg2+-importing ATPase